VPRSTLKAWAFLAVPAAVLGAFVLLPTVLGLAGAFFDWDGSGVPRFAGLANFRALWQDARFLPAARNTAVFALLTVPVQVLAGFLLAAAVNAPWFPGKAAARTMLFMPTVVSIIAIGFVWRWMLDREGGLVPSMLRAAGARPPDFLQGGPVLPFLPQVSWPMLSIAAVQVWRMAGFCMVLYLAALQAVPASLYEAAEIDGASRWQTLRRITWPSVAPMTAFLAVTGAIGALQVFDVVWAMTAEAESQSTIVLNTLIYREFQQSRFGFASAVGVVIFLATAAILAGPRLLRRTDP
jgi:ABC-type sugar transport system permease subunit